MILIFITAFKVEYLIQEVLASVSQKKLLVLCHQFCKVTVEEWHMAYIMIIEEKDEGWRQAGRQAGRANKRTPRSLLLMYFAGLASWRWRVVARGCRVKTNSELEAPCFCRRSCCL